MGARLQYAKVVDRKFYVDHGGRIHPALKNLVMLQDEPGKASPFLVMRAWVEDHGTFTEQWRIETPGGRVVYESTPRELYLATTTHTEKLQDEVAELELEYAADDYTVVFKLDEREVGRLIFPVLSPVDA